MPRFRIAILLGLMLAGSSWAQDPGGDKELPAPTPVIPPPTENIQTVGSPMVSPDVLTASSPVNEWRFWVSADYALAWIKGKSLPALATTGPAGTPQASAGVLGAPGTGVVIGQNYITAASRSMGKTDFGWWFDQDCIFGVAAGFFVTENKGTSFNASSDGTKILARPFTDATTLSPTSVLVAFPGLSSGSVNVFASVKTFWGSYFDFREVVISEPWLRLESLVGYRYLHYAEGLDMSQTLMATGGAFIPGTKIVTFDSFQTKNDFNGCEFGVRTEVNYQRWSLEILTKLAAGNIRREVTINGSTVTTVPGSDTTTGVGGVYALSSNIGNHFTSDWVVAPEIGITLGYQLTSNVRLRAGYSFIYFQDVARAADQIDFTLNQNLFPPPIGGGPNRPGFGFVKSDLWMQAINFGVELRF